MILFGPDKQKQLTQEQLQSLINKYYELEAKKQEAAKVYEEYNAIIETLAGQIGVLGAWQDKDATVYQIVQARGRFVYFNSYEVLHTKKIGRT